MALQAALSFAGFRPLLHVLELNRVDAVVEIVAPGTSGRISLASGRIVDARVGEEAGAAVLARLLALTEGTAKVGPALGAATRTLLEPNAVLLAGPAPLPAEVPADARIEGDGARPGLGEVLELLYFNRRCARVTLAGGAITVARGVFVDAVAGDKTAVAALHALLAAENQPFSVSPAPEPAELPDAPLHIALAAVFEKLADAAYLRRRSDRDEMEQMKSLLEDLAAGNLSPEVRIALARRMMADFEPTPTELLGRLCADPDDGVRAAAKETVEALEMEVLEALIAAPSTSPPLVSHLIEVFAADAQVLVAAASNPVLEEPAAVRLAQLADVSVADALLHSKWSSSTPVRDALARDSSDTMRRAREQFGAFPEAAAENPGGPPSAAGASAGKTKGGGKIGKRKSLSSLPLRDQLYLAMTGNQRQQLTLVSSPTAGVAVAVVASPKMNEGMAMSIAGLTTAHADALRELAMNKRYSLQYPIARLLAFNHKCPPLSAIEVLARLKDNDLKQLAKMGGIAENVKQAAARMLLQRLEKRKM